MSTTIAELATRARNAAICQPPNEHHLMAAPAVEKHAAASTSWRRAFTRSRPVLGRRCEPPLAAPASRAATRAAASRRNMPTPPRSSASERPSPIPTARSRHPGSPTSDRGEGDPAPPPQEFLPRKREKVARRAEKPEDHEPPGAEGGEHRGPHPGAPKAVLHALHERAPLPARPPPQLEGPRRVAELRHPEP